MSEPTGGHWMLVDPEDRDLLATYKWHINRGYWRAYVRGSGRKRARQVYLHQLIGERVGITRADHRNRNKLDNRRENLREATQAENMRNRSLSTRNRTGIQGISMSRGRYRVTVGLGYKQYWGGRFNSLAEAIEARNTLAAKLHGEFAVRAEAQT